MRINRIYLFLFSLLSIVSYSNATAQVAVIDNSFYDSLICVNGKFVVPVTIVSGSFDDTNTFWIELSNATGSFSNPKIVGNRGGNTSGNAQCTLPNTVTAGTGYRIRVRSNYPSYTSAPFPKTLRVSNYPTVTLSSNSPICDGGQLQLTAQTNNAQPTFSWTGPIPISNPNDQNPAINNIPITGTGTYRVTTTSYNCSSTDTIDVLVSAKPIITSWTTDTFACEGKPFQITPVCNICNLPTGVIKYSWSYPPNGTSSQSYINLLNSKPNNQGTYKVTISIGNCSVTDSFTHTVIKPQPDSPSATNNGPLCVGETLILDGASTTPSVSYKWEGPNNYFDSGATSKSTLPNIPKAAEGEYRLYAIKDGCYSKPGVTDLRVGVPLFKLPISGDTALCPGDKLQLSTQTTIAQGIVWSKLPNVNTPISLNRTFSISGVTGKDAGTYQVTQEILGCKSPPSYITINIPDLKNPDPENNGPLCPGEVLQLNATETTGGAYIWTGPNGFASNSRNPNISNVNNEHQGTYTVTSSLEYCTLTASTDVVVKAKPKVTSISSNSPVCTYTNLTLFAESDIDSSTYQWTGPADFSSTKQNPSIYFLENISGTYTVTTTYDGCTSEPASTEVLSREGPGITKASSNTPLNEGDQLELFAKNDKEGVAFIWKGPEDFESDEQNPIIPVATFRNGGEYEVFSIYNTCTTSSKVYVTVRDILGITLDLYPNPNDGVFNLKGITQTDAVLNLNIYNHLGGIVYRSEIKPDKSRFERKIDLTGSPSGVYLLQLITGGEKRTVRFTIVNQ